MCLRHDRASTNLWICSTYKSRNQTVPLFTNVAASVSPSRCKRAHLDRSSWLLDSICLPPVSFFFPPSPSLKGSLPARAGAGEGGGERRRAKFQPSSGSPWAEWKELSFVGTGARHSRTNALSHGTSSSSLETPVCCGLHLECSRQPVHRSPARRWRTRAQRRWGIVPSAWNFWTVDGGHQSARLVSLFSFFSLFFFPRLDPAPRASDELKGVEGGADTRRTRLKYIHGLALIGPMNSNYTGGSTSGD